MYITKLEIKNIRSINQLNIEFKPPYNGWHVIIGDNGAGKSSLIKSISLALIGPYEARSLRQDWAKWININSESAEIKVIIQPTEFDMDSDTRKRRRPQEILNGIRITQVKITKDLISGTVSLDSIKDPDYPTDARDYNWDWNRSGWFSVAFGPFRRFTGGNKDLEKFAYSSPKVAAHLSAFGEDVALWECIEWLKQLRFTSLEKNNKNSALSKQLLDHFINFINNGNLLPNNTKISKITSNGVDFIDANEFEIAIHDLSDGYRSILSMTFELIIQLIKTHGSAKVFKNVENGDMVIDLEGIVLIDEVDAHLHPKWQVSIGDWFKKIFPKIQFIVSTHSPLICRACEGGSIWRLRAPGNNKELSGEVTDNEKNKLIYGNILDAFGTEIFGASAVRSEKSDEKMERLGKLNILSAMGKINEEEEEERLELQKILSTDDPTGF